MRQRIITLVVICMLSWPAMAQEEAEIQIGDTLYFSSCEGSSFKYIDYYVKTRSTNDSVDMDTITQWSFYKEFFETGDFDVTRLPCSFTDSFAVIRHIMMVQDEEENWLYVVIAAIDPKRTAVYLVQNAFIEGEVIHAPKK